MSPIPDLDIPQPAQRPGELIRFVTRPSEQRAVSGRYLRMVLFSLGGVGLGVVLALVAPFSSVSGWILTGVAAIATLLFLMLWWGARKAAGLVGDDLIDLIVTPQGFVTQGGFDIAWSEVSEVRAVRVVVRKVRGNGVGGRVGVAIGNSVNSRLMDHGGANIRVDLRLPDCKAAIARTTTKMQKLVLIDDIGASSGTARAMLGLRPMAEVQPLLGILERECRDRGITFGIATEEPGL